MVGFVNTTYTQQHCLFQYFVFCILSYYRIGHKKYSQPPQERCAISENSLFKVNPPQVHMRHLWKTEWYRESGNYRNKKEQGWERRDHSFNVLSGRDRVLTDPWLSEQDWTPVKNNSSPLSVSLFLPVPWFLLMPEMEMEMDLKDGERERRTSPLHTACERGLYRIKDGTCGTNIFYSSYRVFKVMASSCWEQHTAGQKNLKISQYFLRFLFGH